jgi:hypothetical protein
MFAVKKNPTAKQDFQESLKALFNEANTTTTQSEEAVAESPTLPSSTLPNILFSYFISHPKSESFLQDKPQTTTSCSKPDNLHVVGGSLAKLDFEHQVKEVGF